MRQSSRIAVAMPSLLGREAEYVMDCLDRNELSSVGHYVGAFEKSFAEFCATDWAISCCNGTAALHLAMLALGVKPGDCVIVPALTYVATANAVKYCGAEPIFVDVLPDTWNLDPVEVNQAVLRCIHLQRPVVGIIAVHLYGVPADMGALAGIAEDFGLWVVEDAAEAHGARYEGTRVGAIGDIGTFSFYGNKILTTGEGGMLTTDSEELAAKIKLFRGQGVDPARSYWHTVIGYNYRLTNIQAAIGLAQLECFDMHADARKFVARSYRQLLQQYEVQHVPLNVQSADWMFTVLVPEDVDRYEVMADMSAQGIETRPMFISLPDLPPYKQFVPPVSKDLSARGINLPTHSNMTPLRIARVVNSFTSAVESRRG